MTDQPEAASSSPPPVVCHITTVHPPFDTRIFHKECRALVEAGYEVHLVAQHPRDEVVCGVRIHALPTPSGRIARMLIWPWRAYRKVMAIHPRPVLCHFHDPELLPLGAVLRLRGLKVIYDVHENVADDLRFKAYMPRWLGAAASLAYRIAEGILARGVPTVHVLVSIARHYPEPRAVVRNLPILDAGGGAAARPGAGRLRSRPRLLYVGDVTEERGALVMIRLAAELARRGVDGELRIVGPCREPGVEDRVREAVRAGGLDDRVVIAGRVPFDRVRGETAAADLGLCFFMPTPNNMNSLPNKLMEYMAVGLPVVASNFDCWREYVTDTGAGVQVDPQDVPAIADAVQRLLADPDLRRRMGERGREAVESRYSWQREAGKLLAFYRRLIGPAAPTGDNTSR